MEQELRDILCQQLVIVDTNDLSDQLVQDDLIRLSVELQHKIINGR